MARRWMVCSLCDGSKVGPYGKCVECQGLGGSWYGEDRSREHIELHLFSCNAALEADEAELVMARRDLTVASNRLRDDDNTKAVDRVDALRKQVEMADDSVRYWRAMIAALEVELEECIGRSKLEV